MTPSPKPVTIEHPGCTEDPMRCGTCEHFDPQDDESLDLCKIDDGINTGELWGCCQWRCRKCGGEIKR
jgi:hypothetical protein